MLDPNPAFPRHGATRRCRVCKAPLDLLRAMRRDLCERPACLQHEAQAELRRERSQQERRLRSAVQPVLPAAAAATAPVIWLRMHVARLVPLPEPVRDAQVQHLRALAAAGAAVATGPGPASAAPAEPDPEGTTPARAALLTCAWCQGRCCRDGADWFAFIDAALLRRWQQDHPGSSLADAAEAYIARLPDQHTEGSCCYHGEQGCTLTRSMRSSICNHHVCEGMRELQAQYLTDTPAAVIVAMGLREVQAMLVDETGVRPLPLPPAEA